MSAPDTRIPTYYAEDRAAWRRWLEEHHATTAGVWLVYDKTQGSARRLSYDDIVEEALCFGWVDSKVGKVDERQAKLYVTPRKAKSPWSQVNKQRIEKLMAQRLMTPAGLAKVQAAREDGSWSLYDAIDRLEIPADLAQALAADALAKAKFEAFSSSSKKAILWWIASARRPETRAQRIAETVRLAAHNIKANAYRQQAPLSEI